MGSFHIVYFIWSGDVCLNKKILRRWKIFFLMTINRLGIYCITRCVKK